MSEEIRRLEPQEVWENFYQLTQLPRPSKHEQAAVAYMRQWGQDRGLDTTVDATGNVIIRKPATQGMENRRGVILQAHLDMVPQANSGVAHDFTKDPIDAYVDGEWVTARDTTLGADNGMGVAVAMAILESKTLRHGPLEALFTVDEETGMTGACGLKGDALAGDILINLDSEDEGELYVGCAGGEDANATFRLRPEAAPAGARRYGLAVTGLKGGHSGMDIILGRGNANKLIFRLLKQLDAEFGIRLADIQGGSLRNAIPREAFATFYASPDAAAAIEARVAAYRDDVRKELEATEPGLQVALAEPAGEIGTVMDAAAQRNLMNAVLACPNGVQRMSDSMPGLVETSTNLAVVRRDGDTVLALSLMRSSVDTARQALAQAVQAVFELAGASIEFRGGYPGWKPNVESPILKAMTEVYQREFGATPKMAAVHAGLECGILGGLYPNWDMISCGPTIRFPHSPDEKVQIASVAKLWRFMAATMENIPAK